VLLTAVLDNVQDAAVEFVASCIHQLLQEDEAAAAQPAADMAAAPGRIMLGADMLPAGVAAPLLPKTLTMPSGSSGLLPPTPPEALLVGQQQQDEEAVAAKNEQQQEEASEQASGLGSCFVAAAYDAEAGVEDEAAAADASAERPGITGVTWQRIYLISTYVVGKERLLLATAQRTGRRLLVTPRKLRLLRYDDSICVCPQDSSLCHI